MRAAFLVLLSIPASCAAVDDYDLDVDVGAAMWDRRTAAQALIGVTEIEDDKFVFERSTSDGTVQNDLSHLPLGGLAGQHTLTGDRVRLGIEGGLLMGWRSRFASIEGGGGSLLVALDTELVLTEIFFGGFVSVELSDVARVWAGAGPQVTWGWADVDTESTSSGSDSAFGDGGYWRAGLEVRLRDGDLLGFSVRRFDSDLDFGGAIGDLGSVDGTQWMVTYTTGL